MGLKINKRAYMQLIEEDLAYLDKHCPDGAPELDHIKLIICKSIDWLYPTKLSDKIEHCSSLDPMSEETIKVINKIADEAYKTK